jgi:hypothetical protein
MSALTFVSLVTKVKSMNVQVEKGQENKDKSVSNSLTEGQSNGSALQFVDNRPEAFMQRKLQSIANNNSSTKRLISQLKDSQFKKNTEADPGRETVAQMTGRARPTREQFEQGIVAYKANKSLSRGKDYPKSYEEYMESFEAWDGKFDLKIADDKNYKPPIGKVLYHMTQEANLDSIRAGGLSPKQLHWGGPDPSKDGVLSFATTKAGAGAMGNKSVLLKVTLTAAHVDDQDWWSASATEVRTTQVFAAADVLKYNKETEGWEAV